MEKKKKKFVKCCAAFGCLNTSKNQTLTLFKLPADSVRREKWLKAINREDLLSKEHLKHTSYVVCSSHFEKSAVKIIPQLTNDAIPTIFSPKQSKEDPPRSEFKKSGDIPIEMKPQILILSKQLIKASQEQTHTSTSLTAKILRKRKLTNVLRISKVKTRRLNPEIKIETELGETHTRVLGDDHGEDEDGKRFQNLMEWQNNLKNKLANLCEAEYNFFALNLHYSSSQTYRCLETVLKLPSKSSLNRLKLNIPPELGNRVLESLEMKIKSLPDTAKYCTVCIDKMTLKRHLYYDTKSDEVIGFHSINGNVTPEIASNAYVIMLQGIHFKWNQPIAYALLASAKHYEELDIWLENAFTKLSGIGIKIKALTSDQGSTFDKFAKQIKNVSAEKPYFTHNNDKIYCIFDVPHLIKCIRNNLLASDFYHDGKRISWDYIRQLYDDQKEKNFKALPKITHSHIDPNHFKKIHVNYAVQIFSRTVSAALHTYIDLKKMPEEARPTANFIELMNNLFDVLNSSQVKCDNKYRTALKMTNCQENVLNKAQEMFATTKVINKKTGKDNTKHIKCFVNFQVSIQSIKMLYEDLKNDGFSYLCTRRLNQDNLINFFRCIRRQGDAEPTPIQFRRAFSKLFLRNMLKKSPCANRELDFCDMLLKAEHIMQSKTTSTRSVMRPTDTSAVNLNGETDYRIHLPKTHALTYVSGYLLYKCASKHQCPDMEVFLKTIPELSETNAFGRYKVYNNKRSGFYNNLKIPPKEFNEYIKKLDVAFTQNFDKVISYKPGNHILDIFKTMTPQTPCDCFPLDYLLKFFFRLRIFATLKYNNKLFKDEKEESKKCLKVRQL